MNYKSLPYTIQLDWRTGNVLLNIHDINCKLIINKDMFQQIKNCIELYNSNGAVEPVKQGDIFQDGNTIIKVLDITSEHYASASLNAREDTNFGYINIYGLDGYEKAAFIINSNNEVFLRDILTNEIIKEKIVIFIDITSKKLIYKALPYNKFLEIYTQDKLIS